METKQMARLQFQYNGASALTVQAERQNFTLIEEWLDTIFDTLGVDPDIRSRLQIVADEIFANTCMHAYPADASNKKMMLSCSFLPDINTLELVFVNEGTPFDPLQCHTDPKRQTNEHRPGGFGLYMVQKFADSLAYEWQDGRNILTFRKKMN